MADEVEQADEVKPEEQLALGDRIKAKKEAKKRGRPPNKPNFAPLDPEKWSLDRIRDELSTRDGIDRFRAELYMRARKGGTALELEFIRLERQLLNEAEKALDMREQLQVDVDLKASLDTVNRQLKGQQGSALRADMATAPPPKRGKGALQ